ncbi:MAG TPA: PPK2 family polyphosphate kinase [Gemmatimonadaceae bacterium]|nr:PPK2 family polyphosphate kinase [Gemmatimonadaceae bacterium]
MWPRLGDKQARYPGHPGDDEALGAELPRELARTADLQAALSAEGTRALLIILQGRDASGKDGTVRHVIGGFNPQACAVTAFKRPTELEARHDYLWRVHQAVPPAGTVGVFNRSHYEDVLVPRVHHHISRDTCRQRYREINAFERMLSDNGVRILKFFLHISRDEQARRLRERLSNPRKNWKFDAQDLVERARWRAYTRAYVSALSRCSTSWAPWFIVPADDKTVRNWLVSRTITDTLRDMAPRFPRIDAAVLKAARAFQRA